MVEGDPVAEFVELRDGSVTLAVGVDPPLEVVASQVVVVAVLGEEVPADHQDGVADRYGGLLLADAAGEPPELG